MIAKFTGINKILRELEKGYAVNVGIMGTKANAIHKVKNDKGELVEPDEPLTNAYIGAVHEFGCISRKIPQRSFLRVPLQTKLPLVLKASDNGLINSLLQGRFFAWLTQLGIACETICKDSFYSSGEGSWAPLKRATIRARMKKGADKFLPLLDTGQLRDSISSEVVTNED